MCSICYYYKVKQEQIKSEAEMLASDFVLL